MYIRKIVGACVLAALFVPASQAEDNGFYLGAGFGQARQKFNQFEGNDTSYRLFGGWSINKYFAVEAGYIDGGTQSDRIFLTDVDLSSDGFFAAGLARWPIGNVVAPYAKLGWVFYDSTTKLSAGGQSMSESESSSDFIFGGGLEFKLSEKFRLRTEYEKVNVSDTAYDILSVSATWQF